MQDKRVTVWLSSGDRPRVIVDKLFSQSVADLAWAGDGHTLLACSTDGRVAVLRVSSPPPPFRRQYETSTR